MDKDILLHTTLSSQLLFYKNTRLCYYHCYIAILATTNIYVPLAVTDHQLDLSATDYILLQTPSFHKFTFVMSISIDKSFDNFEVLLKFSDCVKNQNISQKWQR